MKVKTTSTHPLTITIDIRDKEGRKIGEKEVATYMGLLAKAHDEGLSSIETELVQAPSVENGEVAIVRAVATTNKGRFTGLGDANPGNVNRRVAAHILRMAETRAKARALRDAVNIGIVSLEELGELDESDAHAATRPAPSPVPPADRSPGRASASSPPAALVPAAPATRPEPAVPPARRAKPDQPMTDLQRRSLFRIAVGRGVKPEESQAWLEKELGVPSIKALTMTEASRAIALLQARANGHVPPPAGGAA